MAVINVRSIKLVDIGTKRPEEQTETSGNQAECIIRSYIIEAEVVNDDGASYPLCEW